MLAVFYACGDGDHHYMLTADEAGARRMYTELINDDPEALEDMVFKQLPPDRPLTLLDEAGLEATRTCAEWAVGKVEPELLGSTCA
jgi:hypothetical protein